MSTSSQFIPPSITAIVAATLSNGIGLNGGLPWRLPGEMKYFARVTSGEPSTLPEGGLNAVIMGRKTWEGIPKKFRPLKSRRNLVVSRAGIELSGEELTSVHPSFEDAVQASTSESSKTHRIFLIGGAQLYDLALSPTAAPTTTSSTTNTAISQSTSEITNSNPSVDRVLLTRILSPFECDTFLTPFTESDKWRLCTHPELCEWVGWDVPPGEIEEKGVKYRYEMWVRV